LQQYKVTNGKIQRNYMQKKETQPPKQILEKKEKEVVADRKVP
jgi:hypothetical protein